MKEGATAAYFAEMHIGSTTHKTHYIRKQLAHLYIALLGVFNVQGSATAAYIAYLPLSKPFFGEINICFF